MFTRRNFLKTLGLSGLALATKDAIPDILLSGQITRANSPQKADIVNVKPIQINLTNKTTLSGIEITTQSDKKVVYGIIEQGTNLYLVENPAENVIERDGNIVLQPFKSQIIPLDGLKSYWDTDVPIEVISGKIVKPVEITPIQAKVNRTDYKLPFFLINSRAYCIARTDTGVYHLVENPHDNVTLKRNTLTIDGKTSFYLGNLESRLLIKP